MSKPEIIKQLKNQYPKLTLSDIEIIIEVFCETIQKALVNGTKVEIRGFGTFFSKKIKEKHSARNPKTGEIIYVPEKNKVRFRASKKLKDFINQ